MKKFDSETKKRVLDAVKQGATDRVAAGYADITPNRLRGWLRRGEIEVKRIEDSDIAVPIADEQEYARFYIEYKKFESELAVKLINSVATSRAWRAKAWALERRYPNEYGRDSVAPNDSDDAVDWWKAAEESAFSAISDEVVE
jgi:hypothetical protein